MECSAWDQAEVVACLEEMVQTQATTIEEFCTKMNMVMETWEFEGRKTREGQQTLNCRTNCHREDINTLEESI